MFFFFLTLKAIGRGNSGGRDVLHTYRSVQTFFFRNPEAPNVQCFVFLLFRSSASERSSEQRDTQADSKNESLVVAFLPSSRASRLPLWPCRREGTRKRDRGRAQPRSVSIANEPTSASQTCNANDPNDPSHNWAHRAHHIDGYTPSISGSPHCDSRALLNESAVQRMMEEAGKKLGPAPQPSPFQSPADAKNGGDHDAFFDEYADLPLDLSSENPSLKRTSKDDKYSSRDGVSEDSKRAAEDDGDNNSNNRSWSTHTDDNHANVYNNPTDVPLDLKRTSNDYPCSNNNIHTGVPGVLRSTAGFPGDVKQEPHDTVYSSAVESTSRQNLLGPLPPPLPIFESPGLASQLEPIPAGMRQGVRAFLKTNPAKRCDTKVEYMARVLECKTYGRKLTGTWHGKTSTAEDKWICHVQLKHKLFLRTNIDGSETLWTCDDHGKWKRNVHTDMFRDPALKLYRRLWLNKPFFDKWNENMPKEP